MERVIPITTNIKQFYKQYLNLLKPLLKTHLSNGEINVLAELLYHNYTLRDIPLKQRSVLLFDYDTKIEIMNSLNTTLNTIDNTFYILRKKGYINNNVLLDYLAVMPTKEYTLTYKFKINDLEV